MVSDHAVESVSSTCRVAGVDARDADADGAHVLAAKRDHLEVAAVDRVDAGLVAPRDRALGGFGRHGSHLYVVGTF